MRILIFGAGVQGCNLARNLFHAGKDVTLLARGQWAEEIRRNVLHIKDKFSPRLSVSRIKLMCATSLGKICASDHAMNAVDEMRALNRDLKNFFNENRAEYLIWRALEKECGRYLI